MEACGTPCFERACGTIAVLEKLEVSNLIPLKTSQEGIWRCNLPPGHVRLVGERAEESDTIPLLNSVSDLEVECFPAALDRHKDIGQLLRSLVSASPRLNFLQFRVVEV